MLSKDAAFCWSSGLRSASVRWVSELSLALGAAELSDADVSTVVSSTESSSAVLPHLTQLLFYNIIFLLSPRCKGALRNGNVHLFVCLSVCSFQSFARPPGRVSVAANGVSMFPIREKLSPLVKNFPMKFMRAAGAYSWRQ